nr:hypothetical protein [Halomonas azerica]
MVEVDLTQPPFNMLDETGREQVRRSMDMVYYDRDEIILETGQTGSMFF